MLKNYSVTRLQKQILKENDERVRSRIQILIKIKEGHNHRDIASILRISVGKISLWRLRFEKEGFSGLSDKKGRGRKARLTGKQLQQLGAAIDQGVVMKDGYRSVNYTDRHCRYLLHKEGFNLKTPRPRNKSRNQGNVDDFKREFKKNSLVWMKT
jgi:transposase